MKVVNAMVRRANDKYWRLLPKSNGEVKYWYNNVSDRTIVKHVHTFFGVDDETKIRVRRFDTETNAVTEYEFTVGERNYVE